jgi:hypothetical protein
VIVFFMALLSFSWIRHPEPNSSRRATPLLLFQQPSGHSPGSSANTLSRDSATPNKHYPD